MPSPSWRALGAHSVLGQLRADLKTAREEVWLVGPWIDDYFAEALLGCLPTGPTLRVVTRPLTKAGDGFAERAREAWAMLMERPKTELRFHETVHAKVIIIDESLAYCGSANWYRYSLETAREIVLRGPLSLAAGIGDEVQVIWEEATAADERPRRKTRPGAKAEGQREEVLDPIAAEVLKRVKGSFVVGMKARTRR